MTDPTGLTVGNPNGSSVIRKVINRLTALVRRVGTGEPAVVLDAIYRSTLQRAPDHNAARDFLPLLKSGSISVEQIGRRIIESDEFSKHFVSNDFGRSLHKSRCDFVRGLPRALKIIDLGGTNLLHDFGALITLGYPYDFDELVIVDLPHDERHPNYSIGNKNTEVDSGRGIVKYSYHSMVDLSKFDDGYFDLAYSGQTIEHITQEDGDLMLKEAYRVLRPGGCLAVDTPNSRLTRLQQDEYIDPDHKYEYNTEELRTKLTQAGFEIVEAKGLNLATSSLALGKFSEADTARNCGVYSAIEDCYIIAFVCIKPR